MDTTPSPEPLSERSKSKVLQSPSAVPVDQIEREQAIGELGMMFRYATGTGLDIDQDTGLLVAAALSEVRDLSPAETENLARLVRGRGEVVQYPQPDFFVSETSKLSLIIAAHNALARVIAPATPISLAATEPAPGWLGSIRRPPLIMAMIIIALISIVGFVITSVISPAPQKSNPAEKKVALASRQQAIMAIPVASFIALVDQDPASLGAPPNAPSWQKQLNWCFAAALGAVFYVLFTVHEYVKNRTFDPRYNTVYVVRFVLGVVSGLILANVVSALRFNGNETLRSLGPAVAALLGGFSTEAVYQVLQRLVEIMLSAIRGDNSNTAKTQASDKARNELLSLAADPSLPPQTVAKLQAAVKKVGK